MPDPAVVRFDAELLVHRTTMPIGCGAGVVVNEPTTWGPPGQTERRVRRCVRPSGHPGRHNPTRPPGPDGSPRTTLCGLSLSDGAWIDWAAAEDDPACTACHGQAAPTIADDLLFESA